jgi:hypothetical protein
LTHNNLQNKITLKIFMVIFFLQMFATHWNLKDAMTKQYGKATPSPYKALKITKSTRC